MMWGNRKKTKITQEQWNEILDSKLGRRTYNPKLKFTKDNSFCNACGCDNNPITSVHYKDWMFKEYYFHVCKYCIPDILSEYMYEHREKEEDSI